MKILVVTQYYPPERADIVQSVATRLSERGHAVKVLTGYPNYPDGRIFKGYSQRLRQHERDGDVEVLRVPLFADHSTRAVRRALNYVSFALSSASAWRFAKDCDVTYVYAPQTTAALGPWLWRFLGGSPYVLHVQDLWPDSIIGSSLVRKGRAGSIVSGLLNPWLKSVYKRAAGTIGIAPTMVSTLRQRGVPTGRSHLVYNWSTHAPDLKTIASDRAPQRQIMRFLIAGNIGDMQDIDTVIRVAALTRSQGATFTVVGDGTALNRVKALAEELRATNVEFVGRVPSEEMPKFYAEADYAVVTLKNLPAFEGTIPSRFQAAVSYGLPVITNVPGDLTAFVKERDLGITAEVESVEALRDAVLKAIELGEVGVGRYATNSLKIFEEHFRLDRGIDAIEKILTSVVSEDTDFSRK